MRSRILSENGRDYLSILWPKVRSRDSQRSLPVLLRLSALQKNGSAQRVRIAACSVRMVIGSADYRCDVFPSFTNRSSREERIVKMRERRNGAVIPMRSKSRPAKSDAGSAHRPMTNWKPPRVLATKSFGASSAASVFCTGSSAALCRP